MEAKIYSSYGSKVNFRSTSGALPMHLLYTSDVLPVHFRCTSGVFSCMDVAFLPFILGQRDEELFMDKTMVESMPKFRLRHYSYHEKNWTYGGKLYNGKS